MKKIISRILCASAAISAVAACNVLEVESPSAFDASTVYAYYDLAESTVFGITESFCQQNSYRGRFLPWYGFNTDIEWYNGYSNGKEMDGKNEIAAYGVTSNNGQLNSSPSMFASMYMGIERANLVIDGLRQYGNTDTKADMAYLLGEALTLRAMLYYDLTKAWGDVPARFTPLESSNIYVPKASRDVIYEQILADLEEAIGYLPYPGRSAQTTRTDRINKVFAEGLYARIALAASGYAIRPDDGAVGTGNAGSVRLTSDEKLAKSVLYPKALAFLKDAIESNSADLEPSFEQYWRNFNNMQNTVAGPGKETLYVIPFGDRGRWNYTFAVKNEGATINGYAFSQGGIAGPVPSFYFQFDDKDVRKDLTCVNYSWEKDGSITPSGIAKWYFGKYRFEWMDAHPYSGGNDDGIKPVVMRFADILLMAAEIENELNGPTADAKKWFQRVRERAFAGNEGDAETYVASLSSKEAFFKAIVDERAFEFCGEFLRKADLIRWNMLSTKLEEAKAEMRKLREKQAPYDFSGDIYYALNDDEESITIWGLKKSDTEVPTGDDWTKIANYIKYDDSKKSDLYSNKIDAIYLKNTIVVTPATETDPAVTRVAAVEEYMFWPMFDDTITNSQSHIKNDYNY